MDNKSLTHTRRKCQYHIVFISKYKGIIWKGERRYKGNHRYIMQIRYKGVEIIARTVCTNHVHLSIVIPPKIRISGFMGDLKGKSTMMLHGRHSELQSK